MKITIESAVGFCSGLSIIWDFLYFLKTLLAKKLARITITDL
jgi:hypothetical protein